MWALRDAAGQLDATGRDPSLVSAARALLDIPATLFVSTTQFTGDPGVLRDYRRQVAQMLERVLGELAGPQDGGVAGSDANNPGIDSGNPPLPGDAALVSVADAAAAAGDAGTLGGADATQGPAAGGACGCATGPGSAAIAIAAVFLALARRRRTTQGRLRAPPPG